MPFDLPDGLAPEVYPLAWLVGHWRGEGVVGYPGIEEAAFVQDVHIDHDGGPYLRYTSTMRLVVVPDNPAELIDAALLDDAARVAIDGSGSDHLEVEAGPVWSTESGYWRIAPERPVELPEDQFPVELLLSDPAGHLALYLGVVGSGRIELASDLVASTSTAVEVAAGTRLYGLVQGDLMWAWDLAAFGQPLQTYASARLARVEADR
ncbi:FABP family protein [Pengzhenrongella frigida]|uniref:Ferric nitrobindin-like protein n=1 Tax=Pengzhenrongella frigida TaxID=1259133 RepID=A0A4Q5N215_9MICO|nr:FABP family protein [Cellulomonas sp. HLT2-17]RYV50587.1 FABP family protein [Cellulomonas sp. HLT2-17]